MKCIIEGCGREAHSRGLCKSCRSCAEHQIKRGLVTGWDQLVALGVANERTYRSPKGGPFLNALTKALAKALAHQNPPP